MRSLLLAFALLGVAAPSRADTGAALAGYEWGEGAGFSGYDLNLWWWVMDDANEWGYYRVMYTMYPMDVNGNMDMTRGVSYTSPWYSEPSNTYSWYVGPQVPPPVPTAGRWGMLATVQWTNGVSWQDKFQTLSDATNPYELDIDLDD